MPKSLPFLTDTTSQALKLRLKQIAGIALIIIAIAYTITLITHNQNDPSFNRTGSENQIIHNWLGVYGSYISDISFTLLGISAYMLAIITAIWGMRITQYAKLHHTILRISLLPITLITANVTLTAYHHIINTPLNINDAGIIGNILHPYFHDMPENIYAQISIALTLTIATLALIIYQSTLTLQQLKIIALYKIKTLITTFTITMRLICLMPISQQQQNNLKNLFQPILNLIQKHNDNNDPQLQYLTRSQIQNKSQTQNKKITPKTNKPRQYNLIQKKNDDTSKAQLPPLNLLSPPKGNSHSANANTQALEQNAKMLESVLQDFGIKGEIIQISPGPVVTRYELQPAPGTKNSRVISLSDDIARSMSAISVRIAIIPGKNVIGIELPNETTETVMLRELLDSENFDTSKAKLPLILGKDISGNPEITDLAAMPHLLIAGTTGSGKSVGLNAMILSLLYQYTAEQCRFIMIDPKMLELSIYDNIPHLLSPVVTEPKKAVIALKWAVKEMEQRYRSMSYLSVRNIDGYNQRINEAKINNETLTRKVQTGFSDDNGQPIYEQQNLELKPYPYIVVIVDEMADLMLVAGKDIEASIQRLAQMARAAGIHIIMATQRPSVDVITGTIKANFPTRISFMVTSRIDSRTILGEQGAEQLLGKGDMLFMEGGGRIKRVHGPFVDDKEVEAVCEFLRSQGSPDFVANITIDDGDENSDNADAGDGDELYQQAVDIIRSEGKASTSFIQRHLQIGYNRAARIMDTMEKRGVVSAANHAGKREILGV